jgi:hypothetical protein
MDAEKKVLERMDLSAEELVSGCCGMAGAFGYEAGEHHEVSLAVGERSLLPAVRGAPPETLIIADGFSCKHQIEGSTDRKALHLAEVMAMAIEHGEAGAPGPFPERAMVQGRIAAQRRSMRRAGASVLLLGAAALGYAAWRRLVR